MAAGLAAVRCVVAGMPFFVLRPHPVAKAAIAYRGLMAALAWLAGRGGGVIH
jgi:hypothetical protein